MCYPGLFSHHVSGFSNNRTFFTTNERINDSGPGFELTTSWLSVSPNTTWAGIHPILKFSNNSDMIYFAGSIENWFDQSGLPNLFQASIGRGEFLTSTPTTATASDPPSKMTSRSLTVFFGFSQLPVWSFMLKASVTRLGDFDRSLLEKMAQIIGDFGQNWKTSLYK